MFYSISDDELQHFRDHNKSSINLEEELLAERQRNLQLTQELHLYRRRKSSPSETLFKEPSSDDLIDLAQEATEEDILHGRFGFWK